MADSKGLLECVRCELRYSIEDINSGLYELETFTCGFCYAAMQKAPHQQACFSKPTKVQRTTSGISKIRGYEAEAIECSTYCPDRNVCRRLLRQP
jgi:hypothetical protein